MKTSALITFCAALLCSTMAWSQATVPEGSETATIWVDGTNGSDDNPGTKALPFQTIGAAFAAAQNNNFQKIGTNVLINPGTYREALTIGKSYKSTASPMTFQAATPGTVVVSGASPFTSWAVSNGNPSIYTSSWSNQWGFCPVDGGNAPYEPPIVLRREMVFVNGAQMTQVLSLGQVLFPGTFFVDETGGLLYVWPPSGTDMNSADVEVAIQPTLLTVTSMQNVVFRNLTFSYASTCHASPAVVVQGQSSNIIFDSDAFTWNSGQGLGLTGPSTNITVENSTASFNGAAGFQSFKTLNTEYDNITANSNNWRGGQGVYYEWNTGGAHFFSDHSQTINGFNAAYNQTKGLHWDTDVQNAQVSGFNAYQNMSGILVEKSEGPITITGSNFCTALSTASGESGFTLRNSENISLTNSILFNNAVSQILITGVAGGIAVTNWQTGTNYNLVTSGVTLGNNTIEAAGNEVLFKDGYLNGTDWSAFTSTLSAHGNDYWHATNAQPWVVPVPNAPTDLNLPGWQGATGQDFGSIFSAPSVDMNAACAVPADAPDWQFISDSGAITTDSTGSAVFNLSAAQIGGLTGNVSLVVDGLSAIPGSTATFSSSSLTIPSTTALTFNAGPHTPTGTYTITVLANSGDVTRTVDLNVTVPTLLVRLSTLDLSFPNQPVLTSSNPQTVTLSNISSSALSIGAITVGAGFLETNTCGSSLAAGRSCTVSVVFSPHSFTTYSGKLIIPAGGTQTILLSGTTVGSPVASMAPRSLFFGTALYGNSTASQSSVLTNKGTAPMNISNAAVTGAGAADYVVTNNCPANLAVGGTCNINVVFKPTDTGSRPGTLVVTDNSVGSAQPVTLTGTGKTAVTVSPTTVGFGTVIISKVSTPKTVKVTNLSGASLTVRGVTLTGAGAVDYDQTNTCGATLAGGASCVVSVTFAPSATGARNATLNISDSDPTGTQTIPLTGTGQMGTPVASLSPKSLAFASTVFGIASTPLKSVLSNTGTAALTVSSVGVSGVASADYTVTHNCPASLPAGSNCTISVVFQPTTTGSRPGTVVITEGSLGPVGSITLTGTGKTAITVSPTTLGYGTVIISKVSAAKTVKITNISTVSLTVTGVTITGSAAADYSQTNTCGVTLAGGASCTISATFAPSATGARNATLTITDSDPTGTQTVALTGTGQMGSPVASILPKTLAFAPTVFGNAAAPLTTVLSNTGTAALNISAFGVTGVASADYVLTNNCPASLPAGNNCTITVVFQPTGAGSRPGTLVVTDDSSGAAQPVTLTGTGKTAVTVSTTSIGYGPVNLGQASGPRTITVTNISTAALTVSGVSISGAAAADYTETTTCGSVLAGGASCTIAVTFTPSATGVRSATVSITDSDPTGTQNIALTGTGQ